MNFFLTHRQTKCTIKRMCTVLGKIWGVCFNALGEGPIPQKFSNKNKWVQLKGFCQKLKIEQVLGLFSVPFQLRPQLLKKHQIPQLLNCTGEIWGMSLRALGEVPEPANSRSRLNESNWKFSAKTLKMKQVLVVFSVPLQVRALLLKKRQIPLVISPVNLLYWRKSEGFA